MKTLYLTDLDGTLLNNNAQISPYSADILNFLILKGMCFTVATARTYSTVVPMLREVNLNQPLVLMNGVCIYDIEKRKPLKFYNMDKSIARDIVKIYQNHGKYPLMYFYDGEKIIVEYTKLLTKSQRDYVTLRNKFYNKEFIQVENYSIDSNNEFVYAVTLDKKDEIKDIYDITNIRNDITSNFYPDNYCGEYFLENYCKTASKASGALFVKKLVGADKIVAFGDNLNDLPLFQIADEAYAVGNACDELKKAATDIIDTNDNDAVARFLLKQYESGKM